jgi:hypothetical protein
MCAAVFKKQINDILGSPVFKGISQINVTSSFDSKPGAIEEVMVADNNGGNFYTYNIASNGLILPHDISVHNAEIVRMLFNIRKAVEDITPYGELVYNFDFNISKSTLRLKASKIELATDEKEGITTWLSISAYISGGKLDSALRIEAEDHDSFTTSSQTLEIMCRLIEKLHSIYGFDDLEA